MRWSQNWSLWNYSSNFSPNHLWPNITSFRISPLAKSTSISQLSTSTFSTLISSTYKIQHQVQHCRLFLCSEILLFLQNKPPWNASSSLIYLLWILTGRTELLHMSILYNILWNNPWLVRKNLKCMHFKYGNGIVNSCSFVIHDCNIQ